MDARIDADGLQSLCLASAASDFSPLYRIKSITQVAHEYLGTTSIIVYAFNRTTEHLEILAMPGAPSPEFMRGPTDKIIFQWEDARLEHGRDGVWLEGNEDFTRYTEQMRRLALERRVAASRIQEGTYRQREDDTARTERATAKIYLWKGVGQSNDPVGQVFFNFPKKPTSTERVFDPNLRALIRFVCTLIREQLIESLYHIDLPSVKSSPEKVLRLLDAAFDAYEARDSSARISLEKRVAEIICQEALSATASYGGYADLVLFIGEELGRVFIGEQGVRSATAPIDPISTLLVRPDSITGRSIRDRKYFVGNVGKNLRTWNGVDSAEEMPPSGPRKWPPEPGFEPYRSLMIVPVIHGSEVRAVIRLGTPGEGRFLDEQARAMQTLEELTRYAIVRLDDYRQRRQMTAALEFYKPATFPVANARADLMKGVLSALAAEWGTYWEIDSLSETSASISHGLLFTPQSYKEIVPGDEDYGIRVPPEFGFTQALIRANVEGKDPSSVFFCLHRLPEKELRFPGGRDSEYFLEVFSHDRTSEHDSVDTNASNGFRREKVTDNNCLFGSETLAQLNPNTRSERHTRVAFVVGDGPIPRAVVWLKFPDLHEVAWWECQYIVGLSNSLTRFLQANELDLATRSFRHLIPSMTTDVQSRVRNLLEDYSNDVRLDEDLNVIRIYTDTMKLKSAEVRAFLMPLTEGQPELSPEAMFGARPIKDYVEDAIASASRYDSCRDIWKVNYDESTMGGKSLVNGVFYTALHNLITGCPSYC